MSGESVSTRSNLITGVHGAYLQHSVALNSGEVSPAGESPDISTHSLRVMKSKMAL